MQPQDADNSGQQDLNTMSQETLRKYIAFAKETVHPSLRDGDLDKVQTVSLI